MASDPITSWQIEGEKVEVVTDFLFLGSKITVDDSTLMAESEEEIRSLLMRMKEENERAGLKLNIKKLKSWHLAPLLHGK